MLNIKHPRLLETITVICMGLIVLYGCSGNDPSKVESNGLVTHDGTNMNLEFTAPNMISVLAIPDLSARATLDGTEDYNLFVNPSTNAVSGTITNVSIGSHSLEVIYYVTMSSVEVILCSFSTQLNVVAGQSTQITILDDDLDRNMDNDGDGYTNLAEVRLGTNPLSRFDFPATSNPIIMAGDGMTQTSSSTNFTVKQTIGSAIAGTAASSSYTVIVSYTGDD